MAIRSDLDLITIYAAPNGTTESDGDKGLAPTTYYTRLAQRLISAITAQTAEGALYEVDMRLRPSGNAGPVATGIDAFEKYQAESAWTWEHMALTRARVVAGPIELRGRIEHIIRDTLTAPRDGDKVRSDVADMRRRIEEHHGVSGQGRAGLWQVKYVRGGLVDVEFVAQYLQLRHAAERPDILSPNTCTALDRAASAGVLDRTAANDLIAAHRLAQRIQSFLRLTHADALFDPEGAVSAVRTGLARACFPDRDPTDDLADLARDVGAVFDAAYGRFGEIVV
jgi:glutamate-ammonia-ligase adenylyltransferase